MKVLIICFIFAVGLISCGPMSPSSGRAGNPTEEVIPPRDTPFPNIIPTPGVSKGTVVGRLVSSVAPTSSLAGIALYFGTLLLLTPGPGHLVTMDPANSARALIQDDGRFIAENITPGAYVLILWMPHDSHYVPDPNNPKQDLIVDVVGGQIIDLGILQVPPLQ